MTDVDPAAAPGLGPRDDGERVDWLRLIRSENVGPITFFQLLQRFGSAERALDALPELSRRGGRRKPVRICQREEAQAELSAIRSAGATTMMLGEDGYPPALASIADPPPVLTVRGRTQLLKQPIVAVVGARNASANGRRFAARLARDLGAAELIVASGLARGVDASAHEGALASGTVAVVAGGVDVPYPKETLALYGTIGERGVVVAESPLGTVPQARHFPRRNRLISGLSLGVIVVEAALRSGSLITARLALEQGREVCAVPGSPLDPRCRGTNNLIRQGAVLVESAEDVVEALSGVLRRPPTLRSEMPAPAVSAAPADVDKARAAILECLGASPLSVDEIVRRCHMPPSTVAGALLELELAGRLHRHPGHQVSLTFD